METLSNLTQTASKYIYGDKPADQAQAVNTGIEPISGETGKGTKTDPYDAGNNDKLTEARAAQSSHEEPVAGVTGAGTKSDPFDAGNKDEQQQVSTAQTSHEEPLSSTTGGETKTDSLDVGSKAEEPAVGSSIPIPTKTESEHSSAPKENPDIPTLPKEHNVEDSHQSVRKPEGTEKPEDGPSAPEPQAPSTVPAEKSGDELLSKRDPDDHSGEPMKVHDGGEKKAEGTEGPSLGDDEATKKHKADGEGTGEKWVKTSGVAADGGDFDATKPGAGREADRLLEQKGVHKGSSSDDDPADTAAGGDGKKTSITKKLKEKLHIGSSKHA